MSTPSLPRADDGVTLVELLVVMVLSLVVVAVAGGTVVQSLHTQRQEVATLDALSAARTAFERVTRDLRSANPLTAPSPTTATTSSTVDGRTRTATYRLVADRLLIDERTTDATSGAVLADPPERLLLEGVELPASGAVFRWFSADGAVLSAPVDADAVARVTVDVRVRRGVRAVDLSTDVVLRNGER